MSMMERAAQFRKATQFAFSGNNNEISPNDAYSMASIFEKWSPNNVKYEVGEIVRVIEDGNTVLYSCETEHTSQENWKPGVETASLWSRIDVEHAGTIEDPIPAAINMRYYKDKYYSENGVLYLCTRDSGNPLAYLPSQLVGQYFELVG